MLFQKYSLTVLFFFLTLNTYSQKDSPSSDFVSQCIDSAWGYKDKDLKKSLFFSNEALQYATANRLKKEAARSLSTMGVILESYGEFDKALDFHFKSLSILDSLKDQKLLGICLNNIGNVFYHKKNFHKAIYYYQLSLQNKNQQENILGMANTYGNIGLCYHGLKDLQKARIHFFKALDYNIKINNTSGLGVNYNNIGNLYYSNQQHDSALIFYYKALEHLISIGNNVEISTVYKNISQTYLGKNDAINADIFAKKSLEIAEKQQSGLLLKEIYLIFSRIKEMQQDFKESLKYFQLFEKIKDSLDNAEKSRISIASEAIFNIDKTERELEKLQKENEIQRLQSMTLWWSLLLTLALGLLIIALLFIFYQKRLFAIKKKEGELEQKLLRSQINSHFIFNVINSIQSSILSDDKMTAYNYNAKFAKLIRMILENSREKTIPISNEIEALKNYLDIEQFRMENKFDYEINTTSNIDSESQRVPAMLVQPFVENAIWHGISTIEGKGNILITFAKTNNHLIISVSDNGIGRKKASEKQPKLHKSLGIEVTKERLKLFNQKRYYSENIVFEDLLNEEGKASGTKVTIYISLKQIEKFSKV